MYSSLTDACGDGSSFRINVGRLFESGKSFDNHWIPKTKASYLQNSLIFCFVLLLERTQL